MKKTYFITMITAALMGSAYANTDYSATPGATQSSLPNYVYGTYADTGEASGGSVEVVEVSAPEGYEYLSTVYGGYVDTSGDATENAVTINDGYVSTNVYGGYTSSGKATGNTVTIAGGEVGNEVLGGLTRSGNATGNTVTMTGGQVGSDVFGGNTRYGNATDNTVTIAGGYVDDNVYGGYVVESGDATGNTVTMTGGEVDYSVGGGEAGWTGDATDNTVTMTGGYVRYNVYGGIVYDGDATGNAIHLVGEGASYTVGDTTYKGGNIAIQGSVHAGYYEEAGGVGSNNSVHAYGTGASIGGTIGSCQLLTFHLVDDQASGAAAPMLTLGGALDLTGVELGFYGDAVTDWAAFEGKSVTLVSMTNKTITGLIIPSDPVDILGAGGTVLATASMMLSDDAQTLSLQFAGGHTSYTANPGSPQTSAPDSIFGAYSETGNVTGGSVEVFEVESGGYESLGNVCGGYAKSGNVSDCSAVMNGGYVFYDVYGGYTHSGNATENAVTINDGYVDAKVFGGYTDSGDVTGNTVTMTGGEVVYDVYGGYTYSSKATGNTVTMTGGEVDGSVNGGKTYSGNATENAVTMSDGQVGYDVYGGYVVDSGDATGNTVTMTGGEVGDTVYGGYTYSGDATGNTVTMTGGEVDVDVYGGFVDGSGDATGNTVILNNGVVNDDVCAGLTYKGEVSGNIVLMNGGSVSTGVYGAYSYDGNATGNTVLMAGGSAGYVYGGGGGYDSVCVATDNTVIMTGGEVTTDVYGGFTTSGDATNNTVHLVGEGASYTVGDTTYKGGNIAIQGGVHAGYVEAGGVSSNNSVHIHGTGISVGGTIDSCQMLNFHIVQGQAGAPATPMVTLGGALDLTSVELGFHGDAVTNWAAFKGKSITLVSMTSETITGLVPPTDPVDITDEDGTVLGTATLTLSGDQTTLTLTDIQGVGPVPTAGPDALDVALVNSLWASSAYVREFVRLSGAQGYALKDGDTAVWGGGFGTFMHTTGDKGFKSDGGGYGIGVRHAFSANTQAGISLGQGFGSYHNSGADGAKVHQRAILAAATASTRIGKDLSLGGHLAFGNVRNRADCHLDGAPTERARWNDNVFNLGVRAAYDFHVTETTAITPFLGLDWMNGAHESFSGAYGRHYSHGRLNELRMPVGVTVSTSAEVGSTKLLPQLSVAYVPSLAQQLPHADVSGENGDYRVKGYAPGRNAFMLNAGVNAVFSDSWSAGAFYTLETRRHAVDQSVNASVRYTF